MIGFDIGGTKCAVCVGNETAGNLRDSAPAAALHSWYTDMGSPKIYCFAFPPLETPKTC